MIDRASAIVLAAFQASKALIYQNLPAASSRSPTKMPIVALDSLRPPEPKSALHDEI
jgi:hypothetical protein